jgi:hypothetical protein
MARDGALGVICIDDLAQLRQLDLSALSNISRDQFLEDCERRFGMQVVVAAIAEAIATPRTPD